jgi:integrase
VSGAADPCEGVTLPRRRRAKHAIRIPSPASVGVTVNAAEPRFAMFIALCAFAGLRSGEAAAFQAGDIALTARKLHVRRQAQWSPGTVSIIPPKHDAERTVDLPNELVTMLSRHVGEIGVRGDEGWLFGSTQWTPFGSHVMLHHWTRLTDRLSLERHRVHDLRHFYASALIATGCDVVTVQRAMGHANAATTLGTHCTSGRRPKTAPGRQTRT